MDHNESIYNLIAPEQAAIQKPPMYKSKFPGTTPPTTSTFGRASVSQIPVTNVAGDYSMQPSNHRYKQGGALMGAGRHVADTRTFLRKNTKATLPEAKAFTYAEKSKPALVTKSAISPKQPRPSRNFIKENALEVIMSKPQNLPQPETRYTKKADFGKVPTYLNDVAQEIKEEEEYIRTMMNQQNQSYQSQQPRMRLLSEEDRLQLLDNLKKKWESVNKVYQLQTHVVDLDTIGKVKRKEEHESLLQNLEKSIEKLSKKNIFVQEDMYDMY